MTEPVSLEAALSRVRFFPDRQPDSTDAEDAFARLAAYRDGEIYIGRYGGNSEWERHPAGDELVMVLDGETTLFVLENGEETAHRLTARGLFIVPQGLWHRFETPKGVEVMTVTPSPTEHSVERPSS